ncbi:MAG: dTMP kinase [Candidatus Campbellbacteria bacterium]|nr:dTMP kinase [Candidatus Campbellbacteria bacterium]
MGNLIAIEGADCVGKTTVIDMLKKKMPSDTLFFREPGGTEFGEKMRDIIKNESVRDPYVDTLLFSATRLKLIKEKIAPAIKSGKTVILDRFILSTYVYQYFTNNQDEEILNLIKTTERIFIKELNIEPAYFLLECPIEEIYKRMKGRDIEKDSFEETIEKTIEGYNFMSNTLKGNIEKINTNRAPNEILEELLDKIKTLGH